MRKKGGCYLGSCSVILLLLILLLLIGAVTTGSIRILFKEDATRQPSRVLVSAQLPAENRIATYIITEKEGPAPSFFICPRLVSPLSFFLLLIL